MAPQRSKAEGRLDPSLPVKGKGRKGRPQHVRSPHRSEPPSIKRFPLAGNETDHPLGTTFGFLEGDHPPVAAGATAQPRPGPAARSPNPTKPLAGTAASRAAGACARAWPRTVAAPARLHLFRTVSSALKGLAGLPGAGASKR